MRHPLVGYLVAGLVALVGVGVTLLLAPHVPIFAAAGTLTTLGIVVVGLNWGAGPSMFAVLVATTLTEVTVEPLYLERLMRGMPESACFVLFLLTGGSISLLASQSSYARRRTELERLRLRTLLDALPAAVGMMDARARVLETNLANQALWGEGASPPGELVQVQTWRGWWPDTGKPVAPNEWAIMRALFGGETILNQEVEIEPMPGKRKVVLDSAAPIRDVRGVIIGAADIHQDITERKRLEEALRESERREAAHASELEAIFEALTDGLFVYDAEGRIVRHNTAARQLFGFEAQPDVVFLPLQARVRHYAPLDEQGQPIPVEQLALSRMLRGEVLTSGRATDERWHALDGRALSVNITGAPLRDDAGAAITGAVAIVRDVTEQRRLEQHTRETLNALLAMAEALVQTPDQATAEGDAAPAVHQAARRLAELTRSVLECQQVSIVAIEPTTAAMTPITLVGLAPEQAEQWWADLEEHPLIGERLKPDVVAALEAGEPVLLESLQPPPSIWQLLSPGRASFLVPMRIGETLVGLLRVDCGAQREEYACPSRQALTRAVARLGALVLERERLLREREEARASELAVRETQAQMETFLGIVGHELKNPLTSIKLALQLIERRINRPAPGGTVRAHPLESFLDQMACARHQTARLERLVNELLDLARVRAGKLELRLGSTNLSAIVREAVDEQRQGHPERPFLIQLPPGRTVPVAADADRLGQVVTNYLTNALKYSSSDRPVAVGLDVHDQHARVWVRDQGLGIPPEEQERIWDRFHRVKGIQVQSGTGVELGLGLHICRTIVERHLGQVGVQSAPGRGSTFWFTLPLISQQ